MSYVKYNVSICVPHSTVHCVVVVVELYGGNYVYSYVYCTSAVPK